MLPVDGIKGALVQHRSVKKQVKKLFKKKHAVSEKICIFAATNLPRFPQEQRA